MDLVLIDIATSLMCAYEEKLSRGKESTAETSPELDTDVPGTKERPFIMACKIDPKEFLLMERK